MNLINERDDADVPSEWKELAESRRRKLGPTWHARFRLTWMPDHYDSPGANGHVSVVWRCALPGCRAIERKTGGSNGDRSLSNPEKHFKSATHLDAAEEWRRSSEASLTATAESAATAKSPGTAASATASAAAAAVGDGASTAADTTPPSDNSNGAGCDGEIAVS